MFPDTPHKLNDTDYTRFRTLLLQQSGLHFPPNKRRDLELGLRNAMNEAGVGELDVYYRRLAGSQSSDPIWESLIEHVTIGETYFFRNAAHFAALRDHILPDLIATRRAHGLRMLRLWSAGCATGEEPYSLAILLRQLIPDIERWHIVILATDINRKSLMAAQRAVYRPWSFRNETPEHIAALYFRRFGNRFELNPDIRRMVTFAYLNLARPGYPSVESHTVGMDLILCRNVTLYFNRETAQTVVERLQAALLDGGWLVVGHSEPGAIDPGARLTVRQIDGAVVYQKDAAPDPARPLPTPPLPVQPSGTASLNLYHMALALVDTGSVEQAQEHLDFLLQEDPHHAPACWLKGKIYADAQSWAEAARWLQRAVAIDPLLAQAHYLLGLVYEEQAMLEAAVAAFKRALYAEHNLILGHFSLGNLYWATGARKDARRHWQNAADLLYHCAPDDVIPFSDGLTVRRLLPVVQMRLGDVEDG